MFPRLATTASREDLFAVYLTDHDAAAAAAIALAHRAANHVRHQDTREQLERTATDLVEDREALRRLMTTLGVAPATWKVVAAHVAERVGRLKLNGQVLRPSPLGNVWELEGLLDAVSAKRRLWQAIAEIPGLGASAGIDTEDLLQRVENQIDRLHPLWLVATSMAFPSMPTAMPTPSTGQDPR